MKLSICMMVKNEEKNIERCLDSLKPLRDAVSSELIVVDTGSDDGTVDIIRKYTDRIYFHKWNDNFSEMRNITISYAKGEWLFIIDADEVLEDARPITKFLNSGGSKKFNTAILTVKNLISESVEDELPVLWSPRLFRNDGSFKYVGSVHNTPVYSRPIKYLDASLLHFGYIATDKELMERKFERTSRLLLKEIEKNPDNIYYRYQLSVSYGMHNDSEEALEQIEKAYETLDKNKLDAKQYLYIFPHMANCCLKLNKFSEAKAACLHGIEIEDEMIDLYYYLGMASIGLNEKQQAEAAFKKYIDLISNYDKLDISKNTSLIFYTLRKIDYAYCNLGFMLFEREQYAEAYEYVRNVTLKELKKDVTGVVVGSLIKLARYEELFSYYNDLLSSCADAVIPFITNLEQQSKLMEPGERLKLYQAFSSGDDTYSLLNKIRASFYGDQSYEKTWEFITRHIDDVKLDTSADFYGDIIYFLLKIGKPASHILSRMRQETLDRYFEYLIALHDDLIDTVTAYLAANSGGDAFSDVRARKILCRYVLLLGEMTDEQYRLFFTEYIDSGIRYMKMLYNENVLSDRLIYDVKNDEETFIIYMHSALSAKDVNVRECMSFLKRALKAYPSMAKGINLILDEVKAEYDKQRQFEDYKSKVKDNIRALIESGCIKDAEDVIANYEEIVSDDVEIYSMKAVIAITMGRYAEAESVIDKGLALDGRYFDLWYDKGYLYEMQRRYADAADAYEKARDYCGDGMLSDMDELIERMRGKRLI